MFHLHSQTSCPKTVIVGEVHSNHALDGLCDVSVQAEADNNNEVSRDHKIFTGDANNSQFYFP